jgi:hypothetical protein
MYTCDSERKCNKVYSERGILVKWFWYIYTPWIIESQNFNDVITLPRLLKQKCCVKTKTAVSLLNVLKKSVGGRFASLFRCRFGRLKKHLTFRAIASAVQFPKCKSFELSFPWRSVLHCVVQWNEPRCKWAFGQSEMPKTFDWNFWWAMRRASVTVRFMTLLMMMMPLLRRTSCCLCPRLPYSILSHWLCSFFVQID